MLTISLTACTVRTVIPLDTQLSANGKALLEKDGFSFTGKSDQLDPRLVPYLRQDGRVSITRTDGCGDFAYSIFCILTLCTFPAWCPVSMDMQHVDAQGRKMFFHKTYREEHFGWLMPIFIVFPGLELPDESSETKHEYHMRTWNQSILTIVNEMAEAEESLK